MCILRLCHLHRWFLKIALSTLHLVSYLYKKVQHLVTSHVQGLAVSQIHMKSKVLASRLNIFCICPDWYPFKLNKYLLDCLPHEFQNLFFFFFFSFLWRGGVGGRRVTFVVSISEHYLLLRYLLSKSAFARTPRMPIMVHEPSYEIMVPFVLRKLIHQTRMRSHPVALDVWFFVRPFVYLHTWCVGTAKALVRLRRLAWAFAGRLCDKYHNLMSWLIWFTGTLRALASHFHFLW